MKKIILLLIAALTISTIIVPVYAVDDAAQVGDAIFLETKIIENNILYGPNNKTLNQVINDNYTQNNNNIYISLIPNETLATVLYGDYYYNVKTIIFRFEGGPYAIVTIFGASMNFLDEFYIYMPNIFQNTITLIPNQSTYDNGYQQGLKDGKRDGYENGYNTARRIFGIEVNGQWLSAVEYAAKQVGTAIDNTILEWGINVDGILYTASQYGDMRYQQGLDDNTNSSALGTMFSGLASLFGVALAFVLQLGSIELMGISLNMILGIGLLLVGLIAILGLIFGGK